MNSSYFLKVKRKTRTHYNVWVPLQYQFPLHSLPELSLLGKIGKDPHPPRSPSPQCAGSPAIPIPPPLPPTTLLAWENRQRSPPPRSPSPSPRSLSPPRSPSLPPPHRSLSAPRSPFLSPPPSPMSIPPLNLTPPKYKF